MPRKIVPKPCACGCGGMTKGGVFLPGHDAKTISAIIEVTGGIPKLKRLIESALNKQIDVKL